MIVEYHYEEVLFLFIGAKFSEYLNRFLISGIRKGMQPLFVILQDLYCDQEKVSNSIVLPSLLKVLKNRRDLFQCPPSQKPVGFAARDFLKQI